MPDVSIQIPDSFSGFLKTRFGAEADAWLTSIPGLVIRKLAEWNVTLESGIPLHGAMGLVFFVKHDKKRLALKVSWRDELTERENRALKLWDGNGAVELLEHDPINHISLMERLSNMSLGEVDISDAGVEAGKLLRKLGIECEAGFPKLVDRAEQIQMELSKHSKTQTTFDLDLIDRLITRRIPVVKNYLCHGDLAYSNVLQAHNKEWKAIDPKPIIGDLEFCIPELMWTRIDEIDDTNILIHLERIAEAGSLERQTAIDWTIIRAADYYFWAVDNGLTTDPKRCLRLYAALVDKV